MTAGIVFQFLINLGMSDILPSRFALNFSMNLSFPFKHQYIARSRFPLTSISFSRYYDVCKHFHHTNIKFLGHLGH